MPESAPWIPASTDDAVHAVATAIGASDFRRASEIADGSLALGLIHPALFNARALWLERRGQDEEALTEFQRARALAPRDATLLNAIGLCLTRLYRLEEALETFDEAIRINPAYAATHQRKGVVLGMAGRPAAAEQAYKRAVALQPGNAEALASLASSAARQGATEAARIFAERSLAHDPGNATAHAALALLAISEGDFAAAEQRLRPLTDNRGLSGHGRAVALGLLGDALNGQTRATEAFAAYGAANDELRNLHARRFRGAANLGSELLPRLKTWFEDAPAVSWSSCDTDQSVEQPCATHTFLLGFYRSGTTLLEQVLESHPDIVTLEERDFLAQAAERYLTSAEGFDALVRLEGTGLALARSDYWRRVREHGIAPEGKVFVDKHPLNTIKLPLIRKLFPKARIVFALRDPRDVVLSCFRRHFEINAVMYEFLTLEGTARFYDGVMSLAESCRQRLALDVHDHRYEDMIADFDGRVGAVCEFLGVDYLDAMRNFAATARGLDIRSPSAQQVRRGLYKEGVRQWVRYEAELAPVFPLLEPWAERFGYPVE
ncbi:MAG TPA: sulfotransferase [Rhizomicrobium sp.]|jgi:Flp pilus assembly protein TadD|nr:sulfotransferase [Rhizomicrobium sp.]